MLHSGKLNVASFDSSWQTCTRTTAGFKVSAVAAGASLLSLSHFADAAWGLMAVSVSTLMPPLASLLTGKFDAASFYSLGRLVPVQLQVQVYWVYIGSAENTFKKRKIGGQFFRRAAKN